MYVLASQPFNLKATRVLHIIHARAQTNPVVSEMIHRTKSSIHQIIHVGEHFLTANRFNYFDTVILHDCRFDHLKDYYLKLKSSDLVKRLLEVIKSKDRQLIILGNALQLIGPTVNIIPFKDNRGRSIFTPKIDNDHLNIQSKGLNLFTDRFDSNFTYKVATTEYVRLIKRISTNNKIYLLDNNAILTSDGIVQQGEIYVSDGNKFTKIKRMEVHMTERQQEQDKQREVTTVASEQDSTDIDKVEHVENTTEKVQETDISK